MLMLLLLSLLFKPRFFFRRPPMWDPMMRGPMHGPGPMGGPGMGPGRWM